MLSLIPVYFVARDIVFSALGLGIFCTGITLAILLRALRTPGQCLLAAAVVVSSKALMDYSTAGLENPLSHLWLVLFFLTYLRPDGPGRFRRMVLWMGLCLLTRWDSLWFCLVPVVHVAIQERHFRPHALRQWLGQWVGLLPFVAWCVFAVLYYGFLFPSSAYAKLGVHVSWLAVVAQGFCYFSNSLAWDPVTLFTIVATTLLGLGAFRSDRKCFFVALSVVLYLAYVVRVGGDYMSGRFLTEPLVVTLVLLSRFEWQTLPQLVVPLSLVLGLGFSAPRPPLLTSDDYKGLGSSPLGIDDEKGYRFNDTGLLRQNRHTPLGNAGGWIADARNAKAEHAEVKVYKNIGFFGFYAGPDVHVIDPYGIGDALMGHIPYYENGRWDPGHFWRGVPDGYPEAAIGRGTIADARIAAYFEKLKVVTRGPVFDPSRLKLVVRFALGLEPGL
jgi:arabinofuranosyltransferase